MEEKVGSRKSNVVRQGKLDISDRVKVSVG